MSTIEAVRLPEVDRHNNDGCDSLKADGVRPCKHRALWQVGDKLYCGRHVKTAPEPEKGAS
jgi:hypothetical protein